MLRVYTFILFVLFITSQLQGQHNRIPLKQALDQLERKHNVSFSYADELAERIMVDVAPEATLKVQLSQLSQETGLLFEGVADATYLVTTTRHTFCGRVLNHDTGRPMEGAQVILNDNITNILTDENGYARFEARLTFQDTISIKYFGFDTKKVVTGMLKEESCPEILLKFGETTLQEVVITSYITSGIDFSKEDHSLAIKSSDLALLPGETDGDILLAIKTLPGITSPNGKAGNLHVRGSTTDQTLVLFDNIPIYHKGHIFGAISPYNPAMIDEVKVYRSGFGPDLGGRVGGAIELRNKKTVPDSTLFGMGLNSYYGAAFAEVPINEKVAVNASFRSSYPGEWESPKLEAINDLVYQPSIEQNSDRNPDRQYLDGEFNFIDLNGSVNYKVKNGGISLSFLNIQNDKNDNVLYVSRNSLWQSETRLDNSGGNLEWMQYWNPSFSSSLSLTASAYAYSSVISQTSRDGSGTVIIPNSFENNINDYAIHAEGDYRLNGASDGSLNFGYQMNYHEIDNIFLSNRPGQPEVAFEELDDSYLHSLFLNYKFRPTGRLSVNTGLRGNYYSLMKESRLEPRIFLNFDVKDNFSLKSSGGLYSQYISQFVFFDFEDTKAENLEWHLANDDRPVVKSDQWMIGGIWTPGTVIFDVEFYYKNIKNLSTRGTGGPDAGFVNGDLQVKGMDVLLRKTWGKLDTWISYSYSVTEMAFPELNQLTFEAYYDQPHAFNFNGTMPWRKWQFSLGWQYLSGVPVYTNNTFFPIAGENTGGPSSPDDPVPSEENEGRFSAQHQLDLALVYQFPSGKKGWKGSVGLSLLNVYDKENFLGENYLQFGPTTSLEERYSIGFAPNLMITIKW